MMKKYFLSLIVCFTLFFASAQTQITFYTNYGSFEVEMYDSLAPITAGNFINLVNNKTYDGTEFYRVIRNFVVQGGIWPNTVPTIPDEFDSTGTLTNKKMTLSMANSGPNTGSSEFFINVKNNFFLDYDKAPLSSAHPVFGIVRNGWETIDTIRKVDVDGNDNPIITVSMDSLRVTGSYLSTEERDQFKYESAVYPNPVSTESVLDFYAPKTGTYTIEVISLNGKLIYRQALKLELGKHKIPLTELLRHTDNSSVLILTVNGPETELNFKIRVE